MDILKKYSLEFNVNYEEYPPQHYNHNIHCVLDARNYNKPYYVSNYFKRNKQIAKDVIRWWLLLRMVG